ncbi:hypothetical protein E2C01_032066 [Portunus trituberculatus]|uniref:Uncharacterized protein n=1 Tax=Portunus trituberculatus TaxID=210409 RepID=A0A5B7EZB9_PORTR|nr:hypothetical protein [Portunus trituberculatus]
MRSHTPPTHLQPLASAPGVPTSKSGLEAPSALAKLLLESRGGVSSSGLVKGGGGGVGDSTPNSHYLTLSALLSGSSTTTVKDKLTHAQLSTVLCRKLNFLMFLKHGLFMILECLSSCSPYLHLQSVLPAPPVAASRGRRGVVTLNARGATSRGPSLCVLGVGISGIAPENARCHRGRNTRSIAVTESAAAVLCAPAARPARQSDNISASLAGETLLKTPLVISVALESGRVVVTD